jgi:hypothetical protein
MVLALLVPMVGPASAAATYSTGTVVKASAGEWQELGSLKISVPAAELNKGDYLTLRLPSDFDYGLPAGELSLSPVSDSGDTYNLGNNTTNVQIRIPQIKNAFSPDFYKNIKAQALTANELKLSVTDITYMKSDEDTAYLYVLFKKVYVASGFSGSVDVVIEGKSGSPFVDGVVTIAQVGTGVVTLAMDGVKDITTAVSDIDNLRLREDRAGAFERDKTVKLKLPSGFKWNWEGEQPKVTVLEGVYKEGQQEIAITDRWLSFKKDDEGRTLVITCAKKTSKAAYVLISGLKVEISDETLAKRGDVTASVSGTATVTPSSLLVARYGDYGVKVYAVGEPPKVMAGRTGAKSDTYVEIGKFAIEETVKGSLMKDRTITLTLSGGAKWVKGAGDRVEGIAIETAESKNYDGVLDTEWQVIGTAGDTARITIKGTSRDAAKVVYKGAKISVAANASGDIKVTVGGTAGVTGEFVVAKAMSPVTVSVDGTLPNVVIGAQANPIPAIVVSENVAEAIDRGTLKLEFPLDVLPSLPTSVTVVEGDLSIDPNSIGRSVTPDGRWSVDVTVKATSSVPSKIKFEGIKLTLARTVPEGDLRVAVKGPAVVQNTDDFPGYTSVATAKVANVVTPAPTEVKATAVFRIGETKFTLNGVEQTMDVAPYIKNDRTYIPVRFAAQALGVSESNILWNAADQTVLLMKGDRVVKLQIGSPTMYINGVTFTMDVAPELVEPGRTMLPFRWVAQALGATVEWDAATQSVTMRL